MLEDVAGALHFLQGHWSLHCPYRYLTAAKKAAGKLKKEKTNIIMNQ